MLIKIRSFTCILLVAVSATALAQNDGISCLDQNRVQNEVLNVFSVVNQDMSAIAADHLCDSKQISTVVFKSILFLKDLDLGQNIADQFNLDFMKGLPFEYFQKNVKKIVLHEKDSETCQSGALAYTSPGDDRKDGVIHICKRAVNESEILFATVLAHEARHLQGAEFGHQICQWGNLAGQMSCDRSYEDGGSYAINVELSIKLWRSKNLSKEIRDEARANAVSDLVRSFNQLPLDLERGVLLFDLEDKPYFFNGDTLKAIELKKPTGSLTLLRGSLFSFMDPNSDAFESYVFSNKNKTVTNDRLHSVYLDLSPEDRKSVLDLVYGKAADGYACLALAHSLRCTDRNGNRFEKSISEAQVTGVISVPRSSLVSRDTIYLGLTNGHLVRLPSSAEELKSSNFADWLQSKAQLDLSALQPWFNGNEAGLFLNGDVKIYGRNSKTWETPEALTNRKFKRLLGPFVWSEKLKEL